MPEPGPTDLVTLGETMRLLVASPGVSLRRATSFGASIGGAETNVAVGLVRQGHSVRALSRLGDDPNGDAVLAALRGEGIDTSDIERDPDRPTGLLLRDSFPDRPIHVQYHRAGSAASALSADYVRAAGPLRARLVHVTGITAMLSASAEQAVHELLDLAEAEGAAISVDPNVRSKLGPISRWREVVGPLFRRATFVFAGVDELAALTDLSPTDLLADRAQAVIVKHADKSATVTTAAGEWHEPTHARHIVDPVGAGDALTAGYLGGWLRGESPHASLRAGVACAALVVGVVGDIDGLPTARELEHALRAEPGEDVHR
jgi:2-dehydro-3-deoxygluconokinase